MVKCFEEMKDVLVAIKENTRKARNTPSGDREDIIVAGGLRRNSVEMFTWRKRKWSPLKRMKKKRFGATSFVDNDQITIAGGCSSGSGHFHDMTTMYVQPRPDLSTNWSDCPVKLPSKLENHSSVMYRHHQLIVTGGYDGNLEEISDCIHEVQLVPPYTVKTLTSMPEPRKYHCTEIFDDSLLIVGGTTTGYYQDNVSSVVLYDIEKNQCKQLSPLPYGVSRMATVRWQDNIVVIGGLHKRGNELNTVIIYNVKTGKAGMLPPMKYKRRGCTAVVIRDNIVVLGGINEKGQHLKSVEAFNFGSNTWQDLPEMSEERSFHTSIVV